MGKLNVHLFGKFAVHYDSHPLPGLESRKAQELFCYLLLHDRHPHPREVLAGLLWGDTSTVQSKTYLRKALWLLQRELVAPDSAHPLLIEHDWVQINPQADLWLDVAAFEHAFNAVQGIPGEQLDNAAAERLRQAVELYQGELLDGWYQDWCLYERERLQDIYLAVLDKLMGYCEVQCEYERGLAYGAQILRYDRAREQTYRRLMRL